MHYITVRYKSSTLKLQMKIFYRVQKRNMKVTRTVRVERHFALKPTLAQFVALVETMQANFLSLYNLRK